MYRPRIIPVILIDEFGQAVKTIRFNKRQYIGDPVNTVSLFNSFEVDELVLLNIDSSRKNLDIKFDLLQDISQEAKIPFAIGGGIKTLEDIRKVLSLGAEKVIISNAFLNSPSFLKDAVDHFGSSSIVVCIDVKKNILGNFSVIQNKKKHKKSLQETLELIEEYEAGELILQSINQDGTMSGYDHKLLKEISDSLRLPTIALGGCSSLEEVEILSNNSSISGFAAGSMFVFQNIDKGVLINYPKSSEFKALYKE